MYYQENDGKEQWYKVSFYAKLTKNDVTLMERDFCIELEKHMGIEDCGGLEIVPEGVSYTAFAYDCGDVVDISTYDDPIEAVSFAASHNWDEVINDVTGKVIWSRFSQKGL